MRGEGAAAAAAVQGHEATSLQGAPSAPLCLYLPSKVDHEAEQGMFKLILVPGHSRLAPHF